jgi:hypothetical protein
MRITKKETGGIESLMGFFNKRDKSIPKLIQEVTENRLAN